MAFDMELKRTGEARNTSARLENSGQFNPFNLCRIPAGSRVKSRNRKWERFAYERDFFYRFWPSPRG
jgi:hypothetical protein